MLRGTLGKPGNGLRNPVLSRGISTPPVAWAANGVPPGMTVLLPRHSPPPSPEAPKPRVADAGHNSSPTPPTTGTTAVPRPSWPTVAASRTSAPPQSLSVRLLSRILKMSPARRDLLQLPGKCCEPPASDVGCEISHTCRHAHMQRCLQQHPFHEKTCSAINKLLH